MFTVTWENAVTIGEFKKLVNEIPAEFDGDPLWYVEVSGYEKALRVYSNGHEKEGATIHGDDAPSYERVARA